MNIRKSYGERLTLRGLANKIEIMLIILAASENSHEPASKSIGQEQRRNGHG